MRYRLQFRKRFAFVNATIKAAARVGKNHETHVMKRNCQIPVELYFRSKISSFAGSATVKLMFI
jgi:hypothetical protein